jgi:uncharacterized repeat protein (TIGR01451 family)
MSRDPDFEASADMRLLELQRSALGLAPPQRAAWESRYAVESSPAAVDEVVAAAAKSAVLTVSLTANPSRSVIPGTVVTYALSIANDGAVAARDVKAAVPLPGGVSYRLASLQLDGRPAADDAADQLFGEGLFLGTIEPRSRVTLLWKIGVRMGTAALMVVPRVAAIGTAVIGAAAVIVDRKGSTGAFASEVAAADRAIYEPKPLIPVEIPIDERPFYELDSEEEIVHEAADAALSDIVVRPEPELSAVPPPDPEPAPPPEPEPEAEPVVAVREAVVFYGSLERASLAFFDRVFNGSKEPTILQHCIFASALACTLDENGDDAIGLKAHVAAQSQILHRVSLHEKLGKKEPIGEYAGTLLGNIDAIVPRPVEKPPAPGADRLTLVNEVEEPSLAVLRRIAEERERWDFVKARQLTLALQGQRVVLADVGRAAAIDNALRVYAQTSMTVLQKLFVRLRVDRTTGVLFQSDGALDAAARNLLAICSSAMPPT